MNRSPCPLCGYETPDAAGPGAAPATFPPVPSTPACPHCHLAPRDESLRARRGGALSGVRDGIEAIPRGLHLLASTPGVKRWLIPPLLLTLGAFAALFLWLWRFLQGLQAAVAEHSEHGFEIDPQWLQRLVNWFLGLKVLVWLTQASSILVFLLVSAVAAFWAFSIVYEAVSGPFLDEIQGRIEERWFGADPRNALHRSTSLSTRAAAHSSLIAGGAAAVALIVAFQLASGWWRLPAAIGAAALPFAVLGALHREYGRWLLWVVRLEGGTLWVSLKSAAIAGLILLFAFPLKFVPGIGAFLFGGIAGFTTAISLLDIPFERRRFSLRQRFAFLFRHLLAVLAFGVVASLLFILPVIGPLVMVPAASIGGLWLVCRLDKDFLRPAGRRFGAQAAPATGAWLEAHRDDARGPARTE